MSPPQGQPVVISSHRSPERGSWMSGDTVQSRRSGDLLLGASGIVGLRVWGTRGQHNLNSMVTGHRWGPSSCFFKEATSKPCLETDRPSSILGAWDPSLGGCRGKHEVMVRVWRPDVRDGSRHGAGAPARGGTAL